MSKHNCLVSVQCNIFLWLTSTSVLVLFLLINMDKVWVLWCLPEEERGCCCWLCWEGFFFGFVSKMFADIICGYSNKKKNIFYSLTTHLWTLNNKTLNCLSLENLSFSGIVSTGVPQSSSPSWKAPKCIWVSADHNSRYWGLLCSLPDAVQ